MTGTPALHTAEATLEAVRTSRHAAYPEYRPSGIRWLGDVPEHWEVKSLKRSVLSRKGGVWGDEPEDGETGIICVRIADFDRKSLRVKIDKPTLRSIPETELRGRLLKKGDLLLEKSGGGEKQLVGSVMLFDHEVRAVTSNFVARMTPAPGYDPRYLVYLHSCLYSSRINFRSIKQTTGIQNLDSDAYLSEKVAFPPLEEQREIARFLDEQTEKIDALIRAKRDLLALLKEKRQAVITHAITKGLDPAAKLRPSGVEWLGDVPEHWDVKPLRHLGKAIIGLTYSPENVVSEGEGKLVLRAGNIQNGQITDESNVYVDLNVPDQLILRFKDILICSRSGSRSLIGKNALISGNDAGSTFGAFMTVFRSQYNDFLYWILNSRLFSFYSGAFMTTTINQLTLGTLKTFLTPFPPPEEQRAIVRFLDGEMARMDELESVVREAISSLEALRTSIISAAVTGKIDVRGAAAQSGL